MLNYVTGSISGHGLQVNTDLIALAPGETFSFALASSLHPDGQKEEPSWRPGQDQGLADDWDYVLYGKVRTNDGGKSRWWSVRGRFADHSSHSSRNVRHFATATQPSQSTVKPSKPNFFIVCIPSVHCDPSQYHLRHFTRLTAVPSLPPVFPPPDLNHDNNINPTHASRVHVLSSDAVLVCRCTSLTRTLPSG